MCYVTACFLYFPWFWGYVKSQCNLYSKQWQKTAFTRMYYNCLSLFLRPCLPYCCISTVIIMWVHQVSAHAFWRCFVLLLKATKVQGNCHHVFFFMTEWSVPMMSLWWDWGWGFPHRWLLYTSSLSWSLRALQLNCVDLSLGECSTKTTDVLCQGGFHTITLAVKLEPFHMWQMQLHEADLYSQWDPGLHSFSN